MTEPMKRYDPNEKCPKCGTRCLRPGKYEEGDNVLYVSCRTCTFLVLRLPLDAPESRPESEPCCKAGRVLKRLVRESELYRKDRAMFLYRTLQPINISDPVTVGEVLDAACPTPMTDEAIRADDENPTMPRLLTSEEADAFCEKHDVVISWWRHREKHSRCFARQAMDKGEGVYAQNHLEAVTAMKKKLEKEG